MNAESSPGDGSAGTRGSLAMGVLPEKELRMLLQALLDLGPCPRNPRLDGAQRHPQHGGDLLIGHAVDVAQDDRDPHVVVKRLDAFANQPVTFAGLGALLWIGRGDPQTDDVRRLVVRHHAVALASSKVVIAEVRADL